MGKMINFLNSFKMELIKRVEGYVFDKIGKESSSKRIKFNGSVYVKDWLVNGLRVEGGVVFAENNQVDVETINGLRIDEISEILDVLDGGEYTVKE